MKKTKHPIVDSENLHKSIETYCELPRIKYARFREDINRHSYVTPDMRERVMKGIHSYINSTYLPEEYIQPLRSDFQLKCTIGEPATTFIGISVSERVEYAVKNNGKRSTPPVNMEKDPGDKCTLYSDAILNWLEKKNYKLQAAELPVVMVGIMRMTRVDLITLDRSGKGLIAWEIKCGWPAGAVYNKHKFKEPLDDILCTTFNKWHIQAIYTHAGLKKYGLDTICIKILHCWEHKNVFRDESVFFVQARDTPQWAINYEDKILSYI